MSSVLLNEGSRRTVGNGCFGVSVASDPALCVSSVGPNSGHCGEGPSEGGSVVDSGGSPLAQTILFPGDHPHGSMSSGSVVPGTQSLAPTPADRGSGGLAL